MQKSERNLCFVILFVVDYMVLFFTNGRNFNDLITGSLLGLILAILVSIIVFNKYLLCFLKKGNIYTAKEENEIHITLLNRLLISCAFWVILILICIFFFLFFPEQHLFGINNYSSFSGFFLELLLYDIILQKHNTHEPN